jgi:hypothetical protein
MKYIISSHGANIAVALLDPNTAEQDINLSHNLFNTHANHFLYNGVLNFLSIQSFYRFLINKYYLKYWEPNKTFRQILKRASNKARSVINNETKYENFMPQIYQHQLNNKTKSIYKWHHPKYSSDNSEN